ncbi:MAG TPA: hypothetical protein VKE94_21545 [Gemmataceae bacterium]|nr:hypothetical protein [Gemmataceae bacterium]
MAARSKSKNQGRGKRPRRQTEPMSEAEREDLELAEEILRQGRKDQPILAAGFKKLLKQLGITEKPIGAKKLKERMLAEGFDPESNAFSRGIIEMREE